MSVDTDLRARLESLRIRVEWTNDEAQNPPIRVITISSFSKRLLEYGAFLLSSNLHVEPETESVQTTGGGYYLQYRQSPTSPLSRALSEDGPPQDSPADMTLALAEERG
jgi:hypothetical protein